MNKLSLPTRPAFISEPLRNGGFCTTSMFGQDISIEALGDKEVID